MIKKYFPLIALIAAALFFWFVKKNQRGQNKSFTQEKITISTPAETSFNRNATKIQYSQHAMCRMQCRHIDEAEVKEILAKGVLNYDKIETGERGKTYPLEGITRDNQHVRIVVAPKNTDSLVVVTCIDLEKDWPCNCNN